MIKKIFLTISILCISCVAFAGQIITNPRFQVIDDNGKPLRGGYVYSYVPGTTTAKALYSDEACTTPLANPFQLDTNGSKLIYGLGEYKINVKTNALAQVPGFPIDSIGISDIGGVEYYYPSSSATDQGITGSNNTIKYYVDTIGSTNKATIFLRHDSGNSTTTYTLTTSETIPANITIEFEQGTYISGAGTLTFSGSPDSQIKALQDQQIFSTSLSITFSKYGNYYVAWNGAIGNGTTDDTTALNTAFTAATNCKAILRKGATYKATGMLTLHGDVEGDNTTLSYYATTIQYLVSQATNGDIKGIIIDGDNVTNVEDGLFVNTNFAQYGKPSYYQLKIQNISQTATTKHCNAATFYKSSGDATNLDTKLDIQIDVTSVTGAANGVIGDDGGSATGILVSFNGTGTSANVVIHDSIVNGVTSGVVDPDEDSNGIHVYTADYNSTTAKGLFEIKNCQILDSKKRGFKLQAPHTYVTNCIVYGEDSAVGYDLLAKYITLESCKLLAGAKKIISFANDYQNINNFYGITSLATDDAVELYDGSDIINIRDGYFRTSGTYGGVDIAIMQIALCDLVRLDNVKLVNNNNSGSAILVGDTSLPANVRANNLTILGVNTGVNFISSTGTFEVTNSDITAVSTAFARTGNTAQIVKVSDSKITTNIGAYLYNTGGANSAVLHARNVDFDTATATIYSGTGSTVLNCKDVNATGIISYDVETLLSATTVSLGADADTTLYTVPPDNNLNITKAILRVGADAGTSVIQIGANATFNDWLPANTLSSLDADKDTAILMPVPNTTPTKAQGFYSGQVIKARVSSHAGGASNTLYLYGTLTK